MKPIPPRVHAWFTGAWLCLGLLGALAVWIAPRCVTLCEADLVSVPEPEAWREWPIATREAACDGACPGSAGSLGGALAFRHDGGSGLFVAFGRPRADESPRERFLGAFHREPGPRLAFTSGQGGACCALLGSAILTLVLGLTSARRRLRAALVLSEAMQRASLAVTSEAATYRRAPSPRAATDVASEEGGELAVRALRSSLLAAAALLLLLAVAAAVRGVRDQVARGG